MKTVIKTLALAGIAGAAFAAAPASAQVAGIATARPEVVFVNAQARITAYQQIEKQYATQIQQVRTLRQEVTPLQQSLDTNKDGNISEQEVSANKAVVTQIQQKEQQIATATQPIVMAQTYAIEQLVNNYEAARQQVTTAKKIQLILSPDAIQWAPETIDVTNDIVTALNQRVPTVAITPPAGWQPRRESYALQQTVSQIILGVMQQQAAQQAAQKPQPQTSGR